MKKVSQFIVKARYYLLALFVVLVAGSCVLMTKVNINYNILSYLDKDSTSTIALNKMEDEFGSSGQASVMVKNVTFDTASAIKADLEAIDGVQTVVFASSEDDTQYFVLDDGVDTGSALYKIFLVSGNFDVVTKDVVDNIRTTLSGYTIAMNGGAVEAGFLSDALDSDMTKILLIAVAIVLIILIMTSTSWIEPLIFVIVAGGAILINMGTNILLNHIPYINNSMSFITKSIAAVMQLALAMDYSIILLNSFKLEKQSTTNTKEALVNALTKSFAPISSSSITTIVGLVALMFMSFSIGFDVGLVLAKGILISLISVFLFMPVFILMFDKLLVKTQHRTFVEFIKDKRKNRVKKTNIKKPTLAGFQEKTRIIIPVVAAVLIIVGAILNFKSTYSYSLESSTDPKSTINIDNKDITAKFGTQNTLVIMMPTSMQDKEDEIASYLMNYQYKGKNVINSYQGLGSLGLNKELTASQISSAFGLSESIVSQVFQMMGVEKAYVSDLINYINSNNTITLITNSLQTKIYTVNQAYTLNFTSEQFAKANNLDQTFVDAVYAQAGFEQATTYQVLNAISTYDLAAAILNNIQTNTINTQYNALKASGLYDSENVLNQTVFAQMVGYCTAYENQVEGYDNAQTYAQYKSLTTSVNKEALMTSYSFITEDVATLMLAGNETMYACEALKFISLNNVAALYGVQAQAKFEATFAEIPQMDLALTKEQVKANYSVDDETLALLFASKTTITNAELFKFLSDNNYYIVLGNTLSAALKDKALDLQTAYLMFTSDNYVRAIFNLDMDVATEDAFTVINDINDHISETYNNTLIVSESLVYSQIKDTYNKDMVKVNLISFFAILLIIALTFKSCFIPVLLTVIIQGAIWITMGISTMFGVNIFFVCYLVVMCIQMGATVDYAILISNNYIKNRTTMNKKDSIALAMKEAIPTILTSGTILVLATLIIGLVSKVAIVSELGLLLSRGCFISVLMILFCLPQCLLLCDKVIQKTTFKTKFYNEEK